MHLMPQWNEIVSKNNTIKTIISLSGESLLIKHNSSIYHKMLFILLVIAL